MITAQEQRQNLKISRLTRAMSDMSVVLGQDECRERANVQASQTNSLSLEKAVKEVQVMSSPPTPLAGVQCV